MTEIKHSKECRLIANRLIKTMPCLEHIKNNNIKIAFAVSQEEKKKNLKTVLGECMKVAKNYRWLVPYDFIIFIYEPNIAGFSEEQKEILLFHELQHIGVREDGLEPSFYIVPHDVEDFRNILDKYGIDWSDVDG